MSYDFSKNRKYSKIIITLSLIMLFVLVFFSPMVVCADDTVYLGTQYNYHNDFWKLEDYQSSSSYNSNYMTNSIKPFTDNNHQEDYSIYFDGDISNGEFGISSTFTYDNTTYNISDFPYFVITSDDNRTSFYLTLIMESESLYSFGNTFASVNDPQITLFQFDIGLDGTSSFKRARTFTEENYGFGPIYMAGITGDVYCCSNFPYSSIDVSKISDENNKPQIMAGYGQYWYALTGLAFVEDGATIDLNYQANSTGGSITSEDILNNNYLGEDNAIIMDASSLENGSWKVFLDWNINQLSEKTNYQLNATFELSGNVTFEGSGNYEEIVIDTYNLTPTQEGTYNIDKTFTCEKTLSADSGNYYSFAFSENNVSLKDGNNKTVIPFVQLVDNMRGTNSVKSGTANLVSDLFQGSYLGFTVPLFQTHNQIEYNSLNYTCTVDVINKQTGNTILNFPLSQSYDMLTGQAGTFVNGGISQDEVNQVVTDSGGSTSGYQGTINATDWNNSSSSTGGGSASSNSNNNSNIESGAIVINNNPTFNNEVSGGNATSNSGIGSSGILSTIISLIAGNKSTAVSEIEDISGANGYLSFMCTTFSFVPSTVWTALSVGFITCIGIAVVGFIISIVIKFIT